MSSLSSYYNVQKFFNSSCVTVLEWGQFLSRRSCYSHFQLQRCRNFLIWSLVQTFLQLYPDFTSSYQTLFSNLKDSLDDCQYGNKFQDTICDYINSLKPAKCTVGMQKLVECYDMCFYQWSCCKQTTYHTSFVK